MTTTLPAAFTGSSGTTWTLRGTSGGPGQRSRVVPPEELRYRAQHPALALALQFGHLGQDAIDKIARGNAIKLLGLDLPER